MSDEFGTSQVPENLQALREIGPFNADTIPRGLLAEHRLKPGRWARLCLSEGELDFVWDDGSNTSEHLVAPAVIMVPPERPHHLELMGDISVTITFMAEPETTTD
ncbi:hypothetical protein GCM10009127_17930 [Alteraurantiacibacter aestuarii]|uniref:DUF1971 domain-containing protein n=1 Tax=Alteraurantiacibacter aestuarii TaxID=650004 RepID=A0A844ZK24_9SPHN|nr:DUF1971 domain-containing protein [Alteraurantiacibacter aestuarii]MXO87622.1 DUF1971 domain-containing protein [Alteraurantiacibacter aestuarii]